MKKRVHPALWFVIVFAVLVALVYYDDYQQDKCWQIRDSAMRLPFHTPYEDQVCSSIFDVRKEKNSK